MQQPKLGTNYLAVKDWSTPRLVTNAKLATVALIEPVRTRFEVRNRIGMRDDAPDSIDSTRRLFLCVCVSACV